jgi:hypothetical protein
MVQRYAMQEPGLLVRGSLVEPLVQFMVYY